MEIKNHSLFSSQEHQELLSIKQHFFVEVDCVDKPNREDLIKLSLKQGENEIEYAFCEKNKKVFFWSKQRPFQLKEGVQMIPKFLIDQSKQYLISGLDLCLDQRSITVASKQRQTLTKLYKLLKKIISHKGFNEYFKPIKRLGRGSFAAVYLIQHHYTGERYAAKVFSREGQRINESGQEALDNEIRMLKLLTHPNIIEFDGIYQTSNLIYMVTQYLSGGTLQQFMRAKFNNIGDYISQILRDIFEALKYLQELNIMHRDLKPLNIVMRQKDKKWVLLDFGLAAFTNQNYLYTKCGTLGYIAPQVMEQDENGKKYSFQCDSYSIGVISYTMLMGCPPFEIEKEGMYEMKVIWNAFTNVQFKQLDQQIKDLLKGLLEKDPAKRITPKQVLELQFFKSQKVLQNWKVFNANKMKQNYNKILRMRNN